MLNTGRIQVGNKGYLKQQVLKRRHLKHVITDEMRQKKFLLVGKGFNLEQMERLMESHKFYHSVSDGLPERFEPTADYVVFDTDSYSFEEILEWFSHQDKQRKSPLVATYISQSQTILTCSSVIRMAEKKPRQKQEEENNTQDKPLNE